MKKTTGLSFTEAVKSGMPIRRRNWSNGFKHDGESLRSTHNNSVIMPQVSDILATDWEIMPTPMTFQQAVTDILLPILR